MQRIKELEQDLYHIFLNVGVDQADESSMSLTERRALGNPGYKLFKLRRNPYKADRNCLSTNSFHVLQNKNKDENSNP